MFSLWAVTKPHVITLGLVRKVPDQPPDAAQKLTGEDALTLKVRALLVDGQQKEWTTGETHEVTDRSFVVRRALRLNDALPSDTAPHWVWQPGPWLLVDRSTGHVTVLHLPDFDSLVSDAVWFRDYAAYCGIHITTKTQTLNVIVAQLGARRVLIEQSLGKWDPVQHAHPVCAPAQWQRTPVRVSIQPAGGQLLDFEIAGAASTLVEENDPAPDNPQ